MSINSSSIVHGSILAGTITSALDPSTEYSSVRTRIYTIKPADSSQAEGSDLDLHAFEIHHRLRKKTILLPGRTDASNSENFPAMQSLTQKLTDEGLFDTSSTNSTSLSLFWHPDEGFYVEEDEPERSSEPQQPLAATKEPDELTIEQSKLVDQIVAKYKAIDMSDLNDLTKLIEHRGHARGRTAQDRCSILHRELGASVWMSNQDCIRLTAASVQACERDPTELMYRAVFDRILSTKK